MTLGLPDSIRTRTPAPHALKVGLRTGELPRAGEVAAFCLGVTASTESGDSWIRLTFGSAPDTLLILADEGADPVRPGFDHALRVESSLSKACFLAAYFVARRLGGVVQVRQRTLILPAAAFAERYLEDEDLKARWSRAIPAP